MFRWLRVARGMVGTGVSFAVALSGLYAVMHLAKAMLLGGGLEMRYLLIETILTGTAPAGFLIGAGFAGALALTSRGRSLAELSTARFTLLGAAAGFVFALLMVTNTSPDLLQTVVDGTVLALIGGGAAAGTHLIARRSAPAVVGREGVGELMTEHRTGEGR